MSMVRSVVGGVDTHADSHVAAVIDVNGGVLGIESFPADHGVLLVVDTHADTHVAAVVDANGAILGIKSFPAHEAGSGVLVGAERWGASRD